VVILEHAAGRGGRELAATELGLALGAALDDSLAALSS
jgi:hypothetical protein